MGEKTCPMCESQNTGMISTYTSGNYTFRHCMGCDGIFAFPMKAADRQWYETSEGYSFPLEASEDLRWYEMVFLEEFTPCTSKRILNIGCGGNIFLKRLKESARSVTAVDINEKTINFTRDLLGIEDAHTSEALDFIRNYKGEKFDLIVFFEVLEHLEKPKDFILSMKSILRENGRIVFSVPNRERLIPSRHPWDYPPHHLTRWSVKSLKDFLKANGYLLDRFRISPITADSLLALFKANFETGRIEEKISKADERKKDKRLLVAGVFRVLFRLRMFIYKIMEVIARIFTRTKGINLYAVAKVKDK